MKVEELRLLIQEVVRETMREELGNILTEAVQIASTPSSAKPAEHRVQFATPSWVQELDSKRTVQESKGTTKSPMDLLMATAKGMSAEDFNNFR